MQVRCGTEQTGELLSGRVTAAITLFGEKRRGAKQSGENSVIQEKLVMVSVYFLVFLASNALGDSLTVPNTFSSGSSTSAAEMNANFSAVKSSVDDNDARITALETSSDKSFQGFSATTLTGGEGLTAFKISCHVSYAAASVCTSVEFARSPYNSSAENVSGAASAWILPEFVGVGSARASDAILGLGSENPGNTYSCIGWVSSSDSRSGLTVSPDGQFSTATCGTSLPVACCK